MRCFLLLLRAAILTYAAALPAQDAAQLIEQGRAADAERALAAELRAHPDDLRSLVLMGVALDEQKKYEEAEPYYVRALKLAPAVPAVLNNAGNHYVAAGRPAEARRIFERVIAVQPNHPNANLQLAQLAASDKRSADVLRCLGRLSPADQAAFPARVLRARALAWSGKQGEAAPLLKALDAEAQNDPRLNFTLGLAYAEAKLYEEAEAAFTRALTTVPADRDILYNLGLAAIAARHYARATQTLELVLRQKPDDIDALYALARAHAEAGNNEMALLPLIRARKIAPKRKDVLEFLGHVSDALGYYADAVTAYDEFLQLEPNNDVVRRERAFSLVRAERLDDGIHDLQAYVKKYPRDATGYFQLALAESVREPEQALATLNKALALKPDYTAALFSRGALYVRLNRPEEGVADLERVLAAEPDNVRALDAIGQAWLRMDKPARAVKVLARAAELAGEDAKILTHYSQALRLTGRVEESRVVLKKFRQIREETRRTPYGGMLEFLSLPVSEQRAKYFERLERTAKRNPEDRDVMQRYGNELLARRRTTEAIDAYRRILALNPDGKRLAEIARALLDAEQWAPAREFLLAAGDGLPSTDAQLDLAIATFHAINPEAGLTELAKIPEPKRNGDYYLVRAQILDHMGKFEEAVTALNTGFRAAPTRADLYLEASQFLFKHELYREAVDLLDQAIRTVPDSPELRLAKVIALELAHRTTEALDEVAAIQTRWPEWDSPYSVQGIILNINKKPEEARRALETAVALGADTPETYYFLALSISEAAPEETASARQAIAAALALDAKSPYIRALAGKFAYADGDYETAVTHLQASVQAFPDFLQAHYNLANAYRAIGEDDKALAEMKEVRRLRRDRTQQELEMEAPPLGDVLFRVRR